MLKKLFLLVIILANDSPLRPGPPSTAAAAESETQKKTAENAVRDTDKALIDLESAVNRLRGLVGGMGVVSSPGGQLDQLEESDFSPGTSPVTPPGTPRPSFGGG